LSKPLTLDEAYRLCNEEGSLWPLTNVDVLKVKANLLIADEDLAIAQYSAKSEHWNSAYKLYYDVVHVLVESLLCFDKIKSYNHLCLFAHLCTKHPSLMFSWEFLETIRTKRNGINYYGRPVSKEDWKAAEMLFKLYISTLRKEIEKRLDEFDS
jgi:hypothetical protein